MSTPQRDTILRQAEAEIPGFRVVGFAYGRPCVWTVSFEGEQIDLSRSGVETFVAGLRAGYALGAQRVAEGDGQRFAAHSFTEPQIAM